MLGQFHLTGKALQAIKDGADSDLEQEESAFAGWSAVLTSNIPRNKPVPDGDDVVYIDQRTITVLPNGDITEDGKNPGIWLTAHDPDLFDTQVQWTVKPGPTTPSSGRTFRPKAWTFNAPLDGESITLGAATPVPGVGLTALATVPWSGVTGKPSALAIGPNTPNGYAVLDEFGQIPEQFLQDAGALVDFGYCQSELAHGTYDGFDSDAEVRAVLEGIRASGARRVRTAGWIGIIEPVSGDPYVWTGLDRYLNLCEEYDLTPLLVLTSPVGTGTYTVEGYGQMCGAVAARYGSEGTDQLHHYEIWNEPNHAGMAAPFDFGVETYTALLIAASTAIRAADDDAFIVAGGMMATTDFPPNDIAPSTFLQGIYNEGGGPHFDAVGYHWYCYTADFATWQEPSTTQVFYEELLAVRAVMAAEDDTSKAVWVTEIGYPRNVVTDPNVRAEWLIEQIEMLVDLEWVKTWFIYNYEDSSTAPVDSYGVVTWSAMVKQQPTWDTIASINQTTTAARLTLAMAGKQDVLGFTPENAANRGVANGYAALDATGRLPAASAPDISVVDFLTPIPGSQAAMLALSGQKGDWTTRSDLGTDWQIIGADPTQLSSWRQMTYPASPVASVAGLVGIITSAALKAAMALDLVNNTADSAKPVSTLQAAADAAVLAAANAAAVPKALVDAKGDLLAGSANDTVVRVPAGANGEVLTADSTQAAGVRWSAPGVTDSRYDDARFDVGNNTIGPFDLNHGKGTREVDVRVVDQITGQHIIVDWYVTGLNTVRLAPGVVWATGRYSVLVRGRLGIGDVTPPTAPTTNDTAKTHNTITAQSTGSTDASPITHRRFWLNGVLAGAVESPADTLMFTGLLPNTPYTIGSTTIDRAGNESALGTKVVTTNAGPDVVPNAVFPYVAAAASTVNGLVTTSATVSVDDDIIVIACETSHLNAINYPSGFSVVSCVSDNGGALTLLDFAAIGTVNAGHTFLYYMLNPPAGLHNITFTTNSTPSSNWQDFVRIGGASYQNVGSIVARAKRAANGTSAALAAAITSAAGNMAVLHVASATSAITLTAGNNRVNGGADGNGSCDFLRLVDLPGAATVNFAGSNSTVHAYVSADLVKL